MNPKTTATQLILLLSIFLLFTTSLYSQHEKVARNVEDSTSIKNQPSFPGGENALNAFIMDNLDYPTTLQKNNISGVVYTQFYVEIDGKITNITIKKGFNKAAEKSAIKLIKMMPEWIPGSIDGLNRRVLVTLPIHFNKSK